jgi:pterin-4a-carbinolamine dehydratase
MSNKINFTQPALLTPEEVSTLLLTLNAQLASLYWKENDKKHLECTFLFKNFKEALEFTVKVGATAEAQRHHPEITIAWGFVKVELWTHTVNGLTTLDFKLAEAINLIVYRVPTLQT